MPTTVAPAREADPHDPLLTWDEAFAAGSAVVGGKGWNLARLARYGFAVPRGVVVAASIYAELFRTAEVAALAAPLATLTPADVERADVQKQLAALRDLVIRTGLPPATREAVGRFLNRAGLEGRPLAVRSSAVAEDGAGAAFAGVHESQLGVTGLDAVCAAASRCYASLWTPHAVAYRRRMGVADDATPCAVVICEMVGDPRRGPAAAGVAFSCDPVTGERQVVTIELAAGRGGAVVQGAVAPQRYAVRRAGLATEIARLDDTGDAAVLDDGAIETLAALVMRVHWALGDGDTPQDVEWACDGRTFWMLQSRPVTRLPRWTFPGVPTRTPTWSDGNIRDSFPRPLTMATWSLVDATAQAIVYASARLVEYPLPPGMQVMRRFGGRPYFDLDSLQWSLYDSIGILPADTNVTMGGFQPEIPVPDGSPMRGRAGLARARRRMRLVGRLRRFQRDAPRRIDAMVAQARRSRAVDLSTLSDDRLLARFRELQSLGAAYEPVLQLAATYSGVWARALEWVLELAARGGARSLVSRLLAASGDVASAEHGFRLQDLADRAAGDAAALAALRDPDPLAWRKLPADAPFRTAMEDYLDHFGHRAVFEMELASTRWAEDPHYVLEQVRFHLDHPPAGDARSRAAEVRRRAEAELAAFPAVLRPVARWVLARARRGAALRENAKSGSAAAIALIRQVCLEVGRRLRASGRIAAAEDVFHLSIVEVEAWLTGAWDGTGAGGLVADRRARLAAQQELELPGVIQESPPADSGLSTAPAATPVSEADAWTGVAAAPGEAEGAACVLRTPHDGGRMGRHDVLVAPSTDPGWTPLFLRASALVTETGGYLSHGAVVAREFGLPAVVNVRDAMRTLTDGDRLRVDGTAGRVTRITRSPER
ncbi:MAG: PEP-utilizing enzyme [Acidobacteria bacterium]|nr:PEP-utilizing enzyme [Acidobacteriota bacterium]